jgi:hypothetical protein
MVVDSSINDIDNITKSSSDRQVTMDSHPNGRLKGSSAVRSSRYRPEKKSTFIGWTINKTAKLAVWATLATVAFRCPSSPAELTDSKQDIYVCKPYFQLKDVVTPYAQPYYDKYLAKHVDAVRPYANQVDQYVYQPGQAAFQRYAVPQINNAQKYGRQQWDTAVKPQLEILSAEAGKQYQASLAPHVKKAQDVVQPYYDTVQSQAADIWQSQVHPVYQKAAPIAQEYASRGQQFAIETALPQAQVVGGHALDFWSRRIYPQLRILYGENVEPQLLRITERLGRYHDGKKLQAEIKSIETSSKLAAASSSAVSYASSLSSAASSATASPASVVSEALSAAPKATVEPKVQFAEDLEKWKSLATTAVEEGAEDLKERIKDLTEHQISSQAQKVGGALVVQLEETVEQVKSHIKTYAVKLTRSLPEDPTDEELEAAQEDIVQTIRNAGHTIKHKAQAVRDWRSGYDAQTTHLVDKALQSTLETIDNIRELRLTDIGRKYASSSLPHKEWSKYNDLKKSSQDWRQDVTKSAQEHPEIAAAKQAGEDVEHTAMAIAEDAVVELTRLRDVSKWKIDAQDDNDDFSSKYVPPVAKRIQKKLAAQAAAAAEALRFETEEKESKAALEKATSAIAEQAAAAAASASEAIFGTESKLSDTAAGIASSLSSAVLGTPSGLSDSATDVASAISAAVIGTSSGLVDSLSDAASSAASAIIGTPSGIIDSVTDAASKASKAASSSISSVSSKIASVSSETVGPKLASILAEQKKAVDAASKSAQSIGSVVSESASSVVVGTPEPVASQISSSVSSAASVAASSASSVASVASESVQSAGQKATRKVFAGAMAEVIVEAREPIIDYTDEASAGSILDEAAAAASAYYETAMNEAARHYSQARSAVSAQVSGTPAPIHEQMYASVESAYAGARSAAAERLQSVFGASSQGTYESITSAVAAAFAARPTQNALSSVSSVAASRLSEGLALASAQYQSAKIAVGVEPTPVHQQYLVSAQRAYYEGIGLAHDRYSQFLAAASSAVGATPTTGFAGFVAAAQATYNAAVSSAAAALSSASDAAASAVGAKSTPAAGILASLQSQYDAAVAAASTNLAAASSQASAAFYGTQTGVVESAGSAISSAVYGKETSWTESVAAQAAANWEALIASASEQVYGAPPPFTDSI